MNPARQTAIVLANGLFRDPHAKTAHALVRGPSRYDVAGIVDPSCAGRDAGELLDGRSRGVPVYDSVTSALRSAESEPGYCVIGVATAGGVLAPGVRPSLIEAAEAGLVLVNGLHHLLGEDPELVRLTEENGGGIIDIRAPRPASQLRFCSGDGLRSTTLRVAVMGTDCAVGKRTTSYLLLQACRDRGLAAEVIYTGQTGWLQGSRYGFILDATLNDFVCGELEGEILRCEEEVGPDVMILEGQAALRNPTGPCGSEFIVSGGAKGVILQHDPAREYYVDVGSGRRSIRPIAEDIELVRLFGAEVWAVALNEASLEPDRKRAVAERMASELGLPVVLPLTDGVDELADVVSRHVAAEE